MIEEKFIESVKAVAISGTGTCRAKFKVGALLIDKGRIVAAKTNSYKTHPILKKYSAWPLQHAESACIISIGMDNCEDMDMVVTRVDKKNKLTMARPCDACRAFMKDSGINKVFYSNWSGEFECMELQ